MANHLTLLDVQRFLKRRGKPLSRATIYRKMAADEFPNPVGYEGRKAVWSEDDMWTWLNCYPNVERYRAFMALRRARGG